ncbi:MAG: hypothetical protein JWQ43_3740 [Glaciihabitans sp.]|nr:hypothetical protein [Glaciihabitans sp.]
MTYEHELAFNLRQRGIPEATIAETVDEVRAHTAMTGTDAASEFGTPVEYASSFPEVKRSTRGRRVIIVAAVLAIAYVIGIFALKAIANVDIENYVGEVELWPALLILLVGITSGFLTDYLRPAPRSSNR